MKLRLAKKICNIEVNGHFNNKWFVNNKRGKECSPWRPTTREQAQKEVERKRIQHLNGKYYTLKDIIRYAVKHEGPWDVAAEEGYIELYGEELMLKIKAAKK